MFGNTVKLKMTHDEIRVLVYALNELRNALIEEGRYDCVSKRVITTTQVNSYYKRVCSSVGIESSGQHALRHTFATRCIEAGIPAVVLKTWLGHKDIHMTLDTYTDVFQAMDNDAISKYDEHLNSM